MIELEVGDMIIYPHQYPDDCNGFDIGWVIHVETRINPVEPRAMKQMAVVRWIVDDCIDNHWTEWLERQNIEVVKGDNDDK